MVLLRADAILTVEQLPTIMGGLVLAAVLWVVKGTRDNSQLLAVLQSTMERSVLPDLDRLRGTVDDVHGLAQDTKEAVGILDARTTQNEKDITALWDGTDRRQKDRRLGT